MEPWTSVSQIDLSEYSSTLSPLLWWLFYCMWSINYYFKEALRDHVVRPQWHWRTRVIKHLQRPYDTRSDGYSPVLLLYSQSGLVFHMGIIKNAQLQEITWQSWSSVPVFSTNTFFSVGDLHRITGVDFLLRVGSCQTWWHSLWV